MASLSPAISDPAPHQVVGNIPGWMAAWQHFHSAWEQLHARGLLDPVHGTEWSRLRMLWVAAGAPTPALSWLLDQAEHTLLQKLEALKLLRQKL